jgi:hypothetical protein
MTNKKKMTARGYDLNSHHFIFLIKNDMPIVDVVESLRNRTGPMSEEEVKMLADYLDPGRQRQAGARKKNNRLRDKMVMSMYSYAIEQGEVEPEKMACECYGVKSKTFQNIRAEFNKKTAQDFWMLLQKTNHHHNDVQKYLERVENMPAGYWDRYIKPLL